MESSVHVYRYKDILSKVTCNRSTAIEFLQEHHVIESVKYCPGPKLKSKKERLGCCGHPMELKSLNDRTDAWHGLEVQKKTHVTYRRS